MQTVCAADHEHDAVTARTWNRQPLEAAFEGVVIMGVEVRLSCHLSQQSRQAEAFGHGRGHVQNTTSRRNGALSPGPTTTASLPSSTWSTSRANMQLSGLDDLMAGMSSLFLHQPS